MKENKIIRQCEPYGFVLEREIMEMKEEGYDNYIIVDSIYELVEELNILAERVEDGAYGD